MIISRTPYRISFFGGGTDYQAWYQQQGGAVLSATINHYCYLNCRFLPPFFKEKSRVIWSHIENVMDHSEILHPAVRAILDYLGIQSGVEIHHSGDLPARAGLGSSSAFTIGLLHALHTLQGQSATRQEIVTEAIHIERDVLKENFGIQDQIATAYGGINKITIDPGIHSVDHYQVEPVVLSAERSKEFHRHLMLGFTGVSRTSYADAHVHMQVVSSKKTELTVMRQLVDEAHMVLTEGRDLEEFGVFLHESWQLKRSLAAGIAPAHIDEIYMRARLAGATGGKLLGAGGGGFMLFFASPEKHSYIRTMLNDVLWVPFAFEMEGASILFANQLSCLPVSDTKQQEAILEKV